MTIDRTRAKIDQKDLNCSDSHQVKHREKFNLNKSLKISILDRDFLLLVLGLTLFCSIHPLGIFEQNIFLMLLTPFILAVAIKLFLTLILNWLRPEGNL